MKVFRLLGLTVLGIILILVAAIVTATLVIDPNSYKPQIEKAVERSTRLDLTLAGDIDWSLIPLGLSLQDVSAELDGEPFARLDTLVAEVDFWSLLRFEPAVNTFVLEGMTANLTRNEEGQRNWERIMPEQDPEQVAPDAAQTGDQAAKPLHLQINEVRITDAELRYRDRATGQDLILDQVDLTAKNIALGSSFPLDLSFHFATNQPELDVNGTLSAAVEASEDLQRFSITDLSSNFDIEGEPVGGTTVSASFSGNVKADLAAETATLSDFRAQLANLVMQSNLEIRGFGDTPQISGMLELEPFSARELLNNLGQGPIETQDPDVLKALALETRIGGAPGEIQLSDLKLTLDDTRFNGEIGYNLQSGAIAVDLQGNSLNLDRYLPPPAEDPAQASAPPPETASDTAPAPAADTELLPLDALRNLILDLRLGLDELIAQNLQLNTLEVNATARDGLVRVNPISGNLYDGDFAVTAELDARQDNPNWKLNQRLNNVNTLPLLTDLAELDMISGKANLRADLTSRGNRLSALRENAQGTASFTIDDGAFETINLTAYACQGIALANAETINTQQWPKSTRFEELSGVMRINGNILNNKNLSADLAGMSLDGQGQINLEQMTLDYELGLRVVGAIHEHNACRVNERVQNIVIPIECRGSLEQPGELCSFDGSRFRDVLKDMAAAEARRKAGQQVDKAAKKVDKAVDKQLDKILGDKKEGEEESARKEIKDAVRGLFGR